MDSNIIASGHERDVFFWDLRKGKTPSSFITVHSSKISSVDWSYTNSKKLLTSSQDRTVKIWDKENTKKPDNVLLLPSPVSDAKYNVKKKITFFILFLFYFHF